MADLEPKTRSEVYLNAISEGGGEVPEPVTRKELFYSAILGDVDVADLPEPVTREEVYLKAIAENGGGGGGVKQGTFTSASIQYGIVDIEVGFKPDAVMVVLPFSAGDTLSYWSSDLDWGKAMWYIKPEGRVWLLDLGRTTGETGIQQINDNGFSFLSNAANTRSVECTYTAVKFS